MDVSELDILNDSQVNSLMKKCAKNEKIPPKFDIVLPELLKKWVRIHTESEQLFWVSPKTKSVCPMFFEEWTKVTDPSSVRNAWLSDIGLRETIIPSLRASASQHLHDAASIFETLFLGGLGADTLKKLNKDYRNNDTDWKDSEFYSFFNDFMKKDCPLKHFLRHLTLVAERFAEGVVMGPFSSLEDVAKALGVGVHQLSKTPNLAAWEGEFFRICRQYNRVPSMEADAFSYNDYIADFDSPISVTMIRDLAALTCTWDLLTTLDGKDAFNGLMSAREWWQHQVDPVYNPVDGKMWYFVQCSAGFGRKDLAAAYHFYSLYAMSHIATQRIMVLAPEVIPQFSRPKLDLRQDLVVIGNPKLAPDGLKTRIEFTSKSQKFHIEKDYTPPPGRRVPRIQWWESITHVSCFLHTMDANVKDFKRWIWQPLPLAKTKKRQWRQTMFQSTFLLYDNLQGVRVYQKFTGDRGVFACQKKGKNLFWFSQNTLKTHQYELASNANAIEAYTRSDSNEFIPYIVSYDDWAIPGILEPDSVIKYTRQLRLLRLSTLIAKSAQMALATGIVVRELGLRMAPSKYDYTWFSHHMIDFLKQVECPVDLARPTKGTTVQEMLQIIGDLNCWVMRQPPELFEAIDFPIKGHPTTLLGKKLDFVNKTLTLDSKKKEEHQERFKKVLKTGEVTISEFLKITGVLIHWADGSRIRRNLVSPLFKTIGASIAPMVMDKQVKHLLETFQMRSVIELIQKKWRNLLQRTPPSVLSLTETKILRDLTPMFLDPLPAKPILFRNCDVGPKRAFCSDATKKTFGGHSMSLFKWEQNQDEETNLSPFWWALDFSQAGEEAPYRTRRGRVPDQNRMPQWRVWEKCKRSHPRVIGFLKYLRKLPVHIIEFVALLITLLIHKNRVTSDSQEAWSPFLPLKAYCDNQAVVSVVNSAFSLRIFSEKDLEKDYLNFEILANILFRDVLTITMDSPAGRSFKNREFPHLTDTMHLVEVPILPVYVHTSLCTADHLTRGKSGVWGQTPVKIDATQCIAHFNRDLGNFATKQVPFQELLGILDFLENRTLHWRNSMRGNELTTWGRDQK